MTENVDVNKKAHNLQILRREPCRICIRVIITFCSWSFDCFMKRGLERPHAISHLRSIGGSIDFSMNIGIDDTSLFLSVTLFSDADFASRFSFRKSISWSNVSHSSKFESSSCVDRYMSVQKIFLRLIWMRKQLLGRYGKVCRFGTFPESPWAKETSLSHVCSKSTHYNLW